jgi:hypothetical protein
MFYRSHFSKKLTLYALSKPLFERRKKTKVLCCIEVICQSNFGNLCICAAVHVLINCISAAVCVYALVRTVAASVCVLMQCLSAAVCALLHYLSAVYGVDVIPTMVLMYSVVQVPMVQCSLL